MYTTWHVILDKAVSCISYIYMLKSRST
jgi:hypothetical protein